jgi:ABC1 atypical kinase-like domain
VYVAPQTYLEFCNDHVIVQEFISGISCARVLALAHESGRSAADIVQERTGSDLRIQVRALVKELHVRAYNGKKVHGDMHPGNVRFLPNNKVGLIDFGIPASAQATRLSAYYLLSIEYWRAEGLNDPNIGALFASQIRYHSPKLFHSLRAVSEFRGHSDFYGEISRILNTYVAKHISRSTILRGIADGNLGTIMSQQINRHNRFGLKSSLKDISWNRNWYSVISMVTALHLRPEIKVAYADMYTNRARLFPGLESEEEFRVALGDAYQTVSDWLSEVANGDLFLMRDLINNAGTLAKTDRNWTHVK